MSAIRHNLPAFHNVSAMRHSRLGGGERGARSVGIAKTSMEKALNRATSQPCQTRWGLKRNDTANPKVSTDCQSFRAGCAHKYGDIRAGNRFKPHRWYQPTYSAESLPRDPRRWAVPLSPTLSPE